MTNLAPHLVLPLPLLVPRSTAKRPDLSAGRRLNMSDVWPPIACAARARQPERVIPPQPHILAMSRLVSCRLSPGRRPRAAPTSSTTPTTDVASSSQFSARRSLRGGYRHRCYVTACSRRWPRRRASCSANSRRRCPVRDPGRHVVHAHRSVGDRIHGRLTPQRRPRFRQIRRVAAPHHALALARCPINSGAIVPASAADRSSRCRWLVPHARGARPDNDKRIGKHHDWRALWPPTLNDCGLSHTLRLGIDLFFSPAPA